MGAISSGTLQYRSNEGGAPESALKIKSRPSRMGTPSLIMTRPDIDPVPAPSAKAVTVVQQISSTCRIKHIFFIACPFEHLTTLQFTTLSLIDPVLFR